MERQSSSRSILLSEQVIEHVERYPERASARYAYLAPLLLLPFALVVATANPLLVNWSVVVHTPDEAEFTRVTAAARETEPAAAEWYGVELTYRPGGRTLFVEKVANKGLAHKLGVLPGDTISRGTQGNEVVFTANDFNDDDRGLSLMEEVMCFMNQPAGAKLSCRLEAIDASKGLEVDFDMAHVAVSKGEPYLEISVIFFQNVVGATILTAISLALGYNLRFLLNARIVGMLTVLGVGRSLSHALEIMSNGRINAVLYTIVQQLGLVGTAVMARMMLGTKQTALQGFLLTSLSLLVICYIQVPDSVPIGAYWAGFGKPHDPNVKEPQTEDSSGVVYAFAKVGIVTFMGVIGQRILQDPSLKELPLLALNAGLLIVSIVPVFLVMVFYMWLIEWPHGLLGGTQVEFRHCLKDWHASKCAEVDPVVRLQQGWDYRTIYVLALFIIRESTVYTILRLFSALAKDLIKTAACATTYFMSVLILGKQFNFAKCGLVLVIAVQVMQYTLAPKFEEK
mmetsp:Transcript_113271/g.206040  ORF Transcript_113271/g.206040 Transcript_113271/m.206040 type:complete len:511 (+) Transcript_113271:1-1533(+)